MDPDHVTTHVASLVASRICHDLISPVGAIGNGVELLGLSGGGTGPELDLIAESAAHASGRIGFFRVAFGAAAAGQTMSAAEIRKVLDAFGRGDRVTRHWRIETDLPRPEVRCLLLAMLCAESSLHIGGEVSIDAQGDGFELRAVGDGLSRDPALWDPLTEGRAPEGVGADRVQFLLLAPALAALDRRLGVQEAPGALTLTL